jgi:tetratricopeptide (TPR) repeat protein
MADLSMAIRLMPENWTFWYYRATTKSLDGRPTEAVEDFEECIKIAEDWERYPLVHWLYTTYVIELKDKEKALASLSRISDNAVAPQMDYGYCRCVKLYKGLVTPEQFVDLKDMEEKCLKHENRINLELSTMYYGLYAYAVCVGDDVLADKALRELLKIGIPEAFGYKRGMVEARKRGIVQ